jgi:hypothetical protein
VKSRALPDGGALVELGAGTGRLTFALVDERTRIHAVEPARAMRDALVRRADERGLTARTLTVEDARATTFSARDAGLVMFGFNGLLHVETEEELTAVLARVHAALAPGGVFAFDVTAPYWHAMMHTPTPWGRSDERRDPKTGARVLTCDRSAYDGATRVITIDIRYLTEGAPAGVEVRLRQRMWTPQELLARVDDAGFSVELVFGDVDLAPFGAGSPRLLASARRA